MKKQLIALTFIFTIFSAQAYEDSLLCWEKGVTQTDENAIVFLGSGAQYHDIERIELDELNVLVEGYGRRSGDCASKFYLGTSSNYNCQETVLVERIYYSTAFMMRLKLKAFKTTGNGSVLLNGVLTAKKTHDEYNGPVIDSIKGKKVICKHRAE